MSRLRCRIGLHRWREAVSRRPGWHTVECQYCRYRHSEKIADEQPAIDRALSKADRAPS